MLPDIDARIRDTLLALKAQGRQSVGEQEIRSLLVDDAFLQEFPDGAVTFFHGRLKAVCTDLGFYCLPTLSGFVDGGELKAGDYTCWLHEK